MNLTVNSVLAALVEFMIKHVYRRPGEPRQVFGVNGYKESLFSSCEMLFQSQIADGALFFPVSDRCENSVVKLLFNLLFSQQRVLFPCVGTVSISIIYIYPE